MKSWKRAEKEAAKLLGGLRRWRVSYSESVGDVIHPVFSIEVKYGKQVPKSVVTEKPTVFCTRDPEWKKTMHPLFVVVSTKHTTTRHVYKGKRLKFLERGIKQALSYDGTKIPLLAMKPAGYRGMIFCMRWDDWVDRKELFMSLGSPLLF